MASRKLCFTALLALGAGSDRGDDVPHASKSGPTSGGDRQPAWVDPIEVR